MAKRKTSETEPVPSASFEESLTELQGIVSELEDGALGLETSLARFERGIGLLRTCYSILESAEAKVEILTRFEQDQPITAPFETSATFDPNRKQAAAPTTNVPAEDTRDAAGKTGGEPGEASLF
jgi:exodeoxyribonuclease VII small subunit